MNRGQAKGRFKVDKGIKEFLKYYYKELDYRDPVLSAKRIERDKVRNVLKSIMKEFTDVLADGGYVTLPYIGSMRVCLIECNPSEGRDVVMPPDWGRTFRYWKEIYGDISREELRKIKDKPVLRHHNDHTDMRIGKIHLYKRVGLRSKKWQFIFSTRVTRKIAKAVKEKTNTRAFHYRNFRN